MATLTGSVQLRAGTLRGAHRRATPIGRSRWTRVPRTRTYAGDSVKETFTDIGTKKFDLNNTSWRKGGMESEKVDGTVTRLWKFFFRPNDGYVDQYGFSVPMGPLDDVSAPLALRHSCGAIQGPGHVLQDIRLCMIYVSAGKFLTYCNGCSLMHATQCRACVEPEVVTSCCLCRERRSRDRRQERMLPETLPTLIKMRGTAGKCLALFCW